MLHVFRLHDRCCLRRRDRFMARSFAARCPRLEGIRCLDGSRQERHAPQPSRMSVERRTTLKSPRVHRCNEKVWPSRDNHFDHALQ